MSNNKTNSLNNNIVYSKITNGFNDEEIIINNNEQENDDNNSYQYYNNIYNKTNNFEEEDDEKSDDTIVAFQEEKNSNLIESNEKLFFNNKLPREIEDIEIDNKNNTDNADNKDSSNKDKLNDNNNIISKNTKTSLISKKTKKKKKKKKKEKNDKIEIFAQDKDKNKLKQIKLNSILKRKNSTKNLNKKNKNNEKKGKNLILKKLPNPLNKKSKSLSKSIKDIPDNLKCSVELSPSKIIYENGVSDDEEEIKKINKKRKKKKIHLKPIMTPFLLSIKEKNEYNVRLQKIRQQFTEKKFIHEQKFFYYVLKPGNGATLVKNSLKHRINWKEAQMNVTSLFNFKWQTSTFCIDYKNLSSVESIPQIVNHFECHNTISNKSNMFLNLFEYCESNNINIWKYVPLTVFINPSNDNEKCFDNLYDNINKYILNYNDINKNLNIKENEEKYSNIFKTMTFKVFGRRKDVPKDTWMMGSRTPLQIADTNYDGKNFWVLKASNLNRGQCIRLIDSKEKFHEIIKDWSQGINLKGINKGTTENNIQIKINNDNNNQNKGDEIPMSDTYITEKIIVQKYIEKPLCYYGRKCDMRVWVLLTQGMKVYIYKEGHLKTCSEKFDINNNKDAFIHITNYSFQKHCLNFQKFELGNEVPFYDFQKYLDQEYKDKKVNVREHIMNQVKYIVELTMKSVKDKINPNKRNFCFEIFGYDFMMDINLNVYLLEINTNPGLEISSPWIKAIVPRMVDDALRLTIDEVFPTKYQFDKNKIQELNYEDYSNDLSNKMIKNEEKNNEGEGVARIIKRKKYVDICDQGSGTQDKEGEKYIQENLRQKEITIQKKINDKNKNNKENAKVNENNEKNIKDNNNINKDKIKITITLNNNKKENEIKEEKEKEFNQKDYISPFPVPGYEAWENLWEFACELIEEEKTPQNNNIVVGVRGLLEIQKKRQTTSAPNNNNYNKRVNTKSNIENIKNNGGIREKIVKNINEIIKKTNINKDIKKAEKKEIKIQNKKSRNINQIENKKHEKEKNKDIEDYMKDKKEVINLNKEENNLENNKKNDIITKNKLEEEEKNFENEEKIKEKEKVNNNVAEYNKTVESSNIINDNLENENKKEENTKDNDNIEIDNKEKINA